MTLNQIELTARQEIIYGSCFASVRNKTEINFVLKWVMVAKIRIQLFSSKVASVDQSQ